MSKRLEILTVDLRMHATQHDAQVRKSTGSVRNYAKEARRAEGASTTLSGGFRSAATQAGVLYGPLNGVSGRLSAVATGFGTLGVSGFAAAAGVSLFAAALAKAVTSSAQMESMQLKTQALLKATGYAAGLSSSALDANASTVARNTLASIEQIRAAQDVMLTFRTVQGKTFTDAISLSQDLASVMGGDAKSAALQLGKALEDPITGLTALKRSGVSFTETEKDMIKEMVKAGQVAEAQREILLKLQNQIGGTAEGQAKGTIGAVDTLSQSFQELYIQIGKVSGLGSVFSKGLLGWSALADAATNALKPDSSNDVFEKRLGLVLSLRKAESEYKIASNKGELSDKEEEFFKNKIKRREKHVAELDKILGPKLDQDNTIITKNLEAYNGMMAQEIEMEKSAQAARDKLKADQIARSAGLFNKKLGTSQLQAATYLGTLDAQFATEQGKLLLQHNLRLEKIQALEVSKTELQARGFESVAALRQSYALQEDEFYQRQLQKGIAREQQKLQIEETRSLEKVARFLEDEMSAEAREFEVYERRQQMINDALKGREGSENAFRFASEKNWARYQKNLTKLESDKTREQLQNSSELFDSLSGLAKGFAGEQSGIYKAMFIASKAFALADSIMKIQQGIANAASLPFPANLPAIGTVISATAGIVSTIQGTKYHTGGIIGERPNLRANEVPIIGLRGEEVLTETDPRHRNNIGRRSGGGLQLNQTNHFYSDGSSNQEGSGEEYAGFLDRVSDVVRKTIHEEQMPGGMLEAG